MNSSKILYLLLTISILTSCGSDTCDCNDVIGKWVSDPLNETMIQPCDVIEDFTLLQDGSVTIRRTFTDSSNQLQVLEVDRVALWQSTNGACNLELSNFDSLRYDYDQMRFLCPFATQSRSPVAALLYKNVEQIKLQIIDCDSLLVNTDGWHLR